MHPALAKAKEQFLRVYGQMSNRARAVSGIALLATVGVLTYITTSDHTSYETLFSGLSTEDASRITEALKKDKTPFRLAAGGSTILVPAQSVHELRLQMAGQGLPRGGGVGFEIFDNQKFGVSDFAQQINFRRALQGELERTIREVDAVQTARVHLALPERQLFARKSREVSASVTLRLQPGRVISRPAVKSIVHLVSSSITGLSPDAVTIVDSSGRMLWAPRGQDIEASDGLFEKRQHLETTLERRVAEILDRALGPGQSVVKVTAELAMVQTEQTDEEYNPDSIAIRSESTSEEKNAQPNSTSGVPGVRGNLPGGPDPKKSGSAASSKKQVTRNYEVNKTIRKRISPAGELKRLSVAVLINKTSLELPKDPSEDSKQKRVKKKKGKEAILEVAATVDVSSLENVIRQAVGYNPKRGDVVTVRAVPFAPTTPMDGDQGTWVVQRFVKKNGEWITLGGALFAILAIVIALLKWKRRHAQQAELLELPKTVRELEQDGPIAADARLTDEERKQVEDRRAESRQLAESAAEHDSVRAAQVLRAWMSEG